MYRSVSLVAIGVHVQAWVVIRLPSFHEIGAAPGKGYSIFQPVFPPHKPLEIERLEQLSLTTRLLCLF
jgi:hypothetical protein